MLPKVDLGIAFENKTILRGFYLFIFIFYFFLDPRKIMSVPWFIQKDLEGQKGTLPPSHPFCQCPEYNNIAFNSC